MNNRELHLYSSPLIRIEDTLPLSEGNLESLKIWMDLCYSSTNGSDAPQLSCPIEARMGMDDIRPAHTSSRSSTRSSRSGASRSSASRQENDTPMADDDAPMVPYNANCRNRWSSDEDLLLSQLVAQHGHDWAYIVNYFPTRTTRLVKERWIAHVQPSVIKSAWTVEEDAKLIEAVKKYGKYWTPMASMFPGRSALMLKNRYNTKLRHRK